MSHFHNGSHATARRSDYVWQYEYYDDEEPVSFEGLNAYRYSIVIGFWVGLAVFVIFMFFVLTLLTKTGAPHQENPECAEKHLRPVSCLSHIDGPQEEHDKVFSRPLIAGSRSYFNFFINEEDNGQRTGKTDERQNESKQETSNQPRGLELSSTEDAEEADGHEPLRGFMEETSTERECAFLSHFNIPNYVTLDASSTLEEDDLLYKTSALLENQSESVTTVVYSKVVPSVMKPR
ncbi:melanocortin-2 receptor accessory protein 2A-like [Gouania willdenowi]|uniref:Melanocortin 2 receptor accessory protein 2 n=1 Tax=Gouania willdenowi TaxID=441366 RepID=A0A8C5ENB8_GOUWI|nr:melanocortin-2 receptor accessory protein 2 [Gouania willdenowi]